MKKHKSKSIRYGGGQYRPAPNGRGFDCRITIRGKRHESRQPDERAARLWLDTATADTPLSCPLTRSQMLDAQEAFAMLPPGMTLSKLAAAHASKTALEPVTVLEAAERFLSGRERHVKANTLRGYRNIILQLAAACPPMLADIKPSHVEACVSRHGKVYRNTMLAHIKAFLSQCVRDGLIHQSPSDHVRKSRTPEPPKGILTVEQAASLLHAAERTSHPLVPYIALGLFAGIRPGELGRMTADSIRGEYIALTGADTKTADARTIRIRPNLGAWLAAYPPSGNIVRLSERSHLKKMSDLYTAAGIAKWPSDCMRHSFATYAYEMEKDAAHIAAEMGHHGTDVFFRHYRALAMPGEGSKFFSIYPENWERIGNKVKKRQ